MAKLAGLCATIVFAVVAEALTPPPASAISAEVAKKCRDLAVKAHPTPVAGSKASGIEKAQRDYFQSCVARESKEEEKPQK